MTKHQYAAIERAAARRTTTGYTLLTYRIFAAEDTVRYLQDARRSAYAAPKTRAKIRRALKSAEGAVRNAYKNRGMYVLERDRRLGPPATPYATERALVAEGAPA